MTTQEVVLISLVLLGQFIFVLAFVGHKIAEAEKRNQEQIDAHINTVRSVSNVATINQINHGDIWDEETTRPISGGDQIRALLAAPSNDPMDLDNYNDSLDLWPRVDP